MPEIRVLHVLEATTGGTRQHVADILTHLDRTAFAPALLCSLRRDPAFAADVDRFRRLGIPVHVIPMRREISPWADVGAWRRIAALLRATPFDIVHTHSSKAGFLGRTAARAAGVPAVVHTSHVFPFLMEVPAPLKWIYAALERRAAACTDRLLCVCEHERQAALRARIGPPAGLTVIPNGIDPDEVRTAAARADLEALRRELAFPAGAPLIVAVGRLTAQKDMAGLVRAAPAILDRHPRAGFALIGDGEQRPALERLIRSLGLRDRFRLPGQRDDAPAWLALADVVTIPSRWEGLPYSLLEAMALGKPVAATAVGGIPEVVIPGETGILVPSRMPDRLAAAVLDLLADPALRSRMGREGRQRVASGFTRQAMIARLEGVYRDLHERAGRSPA